MIKKNLAAILTISILFSTTICSCNYKNENSSTQNKIDANTPYYSITTSFAGHERNSYMDVDVKIPKITYSGKDEDELFDGINEEIYNNLSKLILEAEDNAYITYKEYLETAKNNFKEDYKNKLLHLKEKYKGIIEETELNMIDTLIASASDTSVTSHAGTEDLIIPELHNKKIIIVETTESSNSNNESQSTIHIEGRPKAGKDIIEEESTNVETDNGKNTKFNNGERKKRNATENEIERTEKVTIANTEESLEENTNNETSAETSVEAITETNIENATSSEELTETENNESTSSNVTNKENIASTSDIKEESIIENFYSDLIDIVYSNTAPNDAELTKLYTPTKVSCGFDVKCLDEDYLSLFIELNETKTAPKISRFFYNIDLKEKKIVKLSDVLGENYKAICINNINEAILNFSDEEKAKLKSNYNIEDYINDDTAFFINNNHIPVVELDKWAITNDYLEFQIFKETSKK